MLVELGDQVEDDERFDHATQPRDANGRFAKVAGAKASVAEHIAAHLTANGHKAEARGSTVHLKNGGTIDVGNKGDRGYNGTRAKVQVTVEQHLREHPDKHVRDWAAKTAPPPPPPRPPRKVDPAKAAAREKVRAEKAAAREEHAKAREAQRTERATVKEQRQKAIADRKAARDSKRAGQVAAIKAIGAPVTPDGKVDATRVPGATKDFTPPTSADPDNSFRGRSYVARSAKEMTSEFLGASARGGTNEDIIRSQLGHLDVRDATQWEAIAEKYETGPLHTLDEAMTALARAAATKSPTRRPDWRDLDFDVLRECPGLEHLEKPSWLHDAQNEREQREHMAAYYGDHEHAGDDGDSHAEGGTYTPPGDDEDVPF